MAFNDDLQTLLEQETVTSQDITKLVGKHFVPKKDFNDRNNEVKTLQEELETEKNKNLTVEQQLQAKLDKAIEQAEQTQKEFTLKSNNLEIEKMFTQAGIQQEDYQDLLNSIVSEDLEKSKATAQGFINILEKQVNVTKETTTQQLLDGTPEPKFENVPDDTQSGILGTVVDDSGNEFKLGALPE